MVGGKEMIRKKLQVKCPDIKKCQHNIDAETFRKYCCGQEYSPFQCIWYEERHTIKMTPFQWAKIKKLLEVPSCSK